MTTMETMRRAKIEFASGNLRNSINLFNLVENTEGGNVELWLSRGAAEMAVGRFNEARTDFDRVLNQEKENERAYFFRGVANLALAEYEAAIQDLTNCLRRNNDRGIAHLARGLAYAELGQEDEATLEFNSASAFSEAELKSFTNLFGQTNINPFKNSRELLARENAPWNSLLGKENGKKLLRFFE